ncbi:hypothetical protein Syun_023389 [Stephania yunnanensis]|uniref:Pentatricopeptide repeat-containing protein n=1 Tax=Stephania yunnanensis TaxID=152371 RepID=A0AAP0FMP8_9MAGN
MVSSTTAIRAPTWVSKRRLFEQQLSQLHKCSNLNHLKQIHAQIFRANLQQDLYVAPKLIVAFARFRQMPLALNVFNQIQHPNVLLYNTLIRAYAQNAQHSHAFSAFFEMQNNGVCPDNFTYSFLLKACSGEFGLDQVQMIHAHIEKFSFSSDIFVPNSLIDCYSKIGARGIIAAKRVFDSMPERDVVSWNSMISGLVKVGELDKACQLFEEMPERDSVSWNAILDGYVKAGKMDVAFQLFGRMPERNVISWSTLILGYSKAGDIDMARMLFDRMPVKNLVTWTIMIAGYAEKGLAKEAFCLFDQLEKSGMEPDDGTYVSILSACAESGLLGLGKRAHASYKRERLGYSTLVCNALVDMYSKCGNLDAAMEIFNGMVRKDVVSWNSILQGLAVHGHGERALKLFSRMRNEGVLPDGVTFVGVLCACTHIGLVNDGRRYFTMMERDYGIAPQVEHYGCMIDLLGKGGHLKEAFELVERMPMEPNAIIWGTLLGACRMHYNVELAEEVVDRLIKLEPSNAGNYAILCTIYAAAGHWEDFAKVRLRMKSASVSKQAGASLIELDDEVHAFTVADRSHPHSSRIYSMMDRLGKHLKQVGYVPNVHY